MLANYLPVLIFLGVAGVLGAVLLFIGFALGRGRKDSEKLSAYEADVSARRKALFEQIDALQAEITRRYKTGEASVESLLQ